mmetsp:Transcript_12869/g.26285  ORF Transcript_12869/g.26285 Transcript_12869/m.26285 type:complete len:373 (+) Transcript_12869:1234-2352(+)
MPRSFDAFGAFIIVKLLGRRRMPYESSAGNCIELCLRSCRPRLGGDAEADLGAPEAKPFANGLYLPTFLSPPRYAGVLTRFSEILPGGETIDGSWISAAEDGRDLKLVRSSVARGTGGGGAVGELRSLILPTGEASSGGIRLMQGGPLGSRERMYGALIFSLRCRGRIGADRARLNEATLSSSFSSSSSLSPLLFLSLMACGSERANGVPDGASASQSLPPPLQRLPRAWYALEVLRSNSKSSEGEGLRERLWTRNRGVDCVVGGDTASLPLAAASSLLHAAACARVRAFSSRLNRLTASFLSLLLRISGGECDCSRTRFSYILMRSFSALRCPPRGGDIDLALDTRQRPFGRCRRCCCFCCCCCCCFRCCC